MTMTIILYINAVTEILEVLEIEDFVSGVEWPFKSTDPCMVYGRPSNNRAVITEDSRISAERASRPSWHYPSTSSLWERIITKGHDR